LDGVRGVVAEVLGVAPAEVDVRAPLSKQKVPADELDAVEIVLRVEETFGVEIPDEEMGGPDGEWEANLSVEKLAQIVAARRSRK
jgi:acyl carrier protein